MTELPGFQVIPGTWADPCVLLDGEEIFLYPTKDCVGWQYPKLHAFRSRNLSQWEGPFEILDLADVSWANRFVYAPGVVRRRSCSYLYFCADNQIGLATCTDPLGKFVDLLGEPLIARGAGGCQSIDPDLFVDDDGQVYLVWGQGKCWIVPLNEDMQTFMSSPRCLSDDLYRQTGREPSSFDREYERRGGDPYAFDITLYNEASHITKVDGRYLWLWSVYDARDPRYSVRFAWADNVLGPYVMPSNNVLLKSCGPAGGTGHATTLFFQNSWHLFYHRHGHPVPKREWSLETAWNGVDGTDREVCRSVLQFVDGNPVPIILG